jgi:hypothetical protein
MAMQERRTDDRGRSFLGGRIVFNNRCSSIDCVVRDMSSTGARVRVSTAVMLPDEFELMVPKQGRSWKVRIAWRKPQEFGLEFLDWDGSRDAAPLEIAARLRKLEEEKEVLRARVTQLSSAE